MGIVVGLIGLSHPHAPAFLRTFEALDEVAGVALSDPDPAVLARVAATTSKAERTYSELEPLLARPDVPIVLVALPTDRVPSAIVAAARAAKHVICEKPCARSAGELAPVLPALEENRVHFTVPYVWRAHPAMRQLRAFVAAGAVGPVVSFELRLVTTRVGLRNPSHWLFKRAIAGGGILSWLGCHWLDLLRYLTGQEVVAVSALMGAVGGEAIDVEDVASLALRLQNGAIGSLHAGYLLPSGRAGYEGTSYDQSILLWGREGTLRYGQEGEDHVVSLASATEEWRAASRQELRFRLPPSPAYGGAHGLAFFARFLRLVRTSEGQNQVTVWDALRVLEILDAAYESARTGRTVELSPASAPGGEPGDVS